MEHLITDDIPQGCFQKIVLSLKVIIYFFSVSLLNLLSGLMREVEPHICFEPDPPSKWSDERVQMERAGTPPCLRPTSQCIFFQICFLSEILCRIVFLDFFADGSRGDSTLLEADQAVQ